MGGPFSAAPSCPVTQLLPGHGGKDPLQHTNPSQPIPAPSFPGVSHRRTEKALQALPSWSGSTFLHFPRLPPTPPLRGGRPAEHVSVPASYMQHLSTFLPSRLRHPISHRRTLRCTEVRRLAKLMQLVKGISCLHPDPTFTKSDFQPHLCGVILPDHNGAGGPHSARSTGPLRQTHHPKEPWPPGKLTWSSLKTLVGSASPCLK